MAFCVFWYQNHNDISFNISLLMMSYLTSQSRFLFKRQRVQSSTICYKMQIFSVALLLFTIFQDVEPDKFRNPRHFSFFKTDKKMLAKNSFNTKSDGSESPNGFESFKTSSKSKSSSLPFLTGIDDTRVGKIRCNNGI